MTGIVWRTQSPSLIHASDSALSFQKWAEVVILIDLLLYGALPFPLVTHNILSLFYMFCAIGCLTLIHSTSISLKFLSGFSCFTLMRCKEDPKTCYGRCRSYCLHNRKSKLAEMSYLLAQGSTMIQTGSVVLCGDLCIVCWPLIFVECGEVCHSGMVDWASNIVSSCYLICNFFKHLILCLLPIAGYLLGLGFDWSMTMKNNLGNEWLPVSLTFRVWL